MVQVKVGWLCVAASRLGSAGGLVQPPGIARRGTRATIISADGAPARRFDLTPHLIDSRGNFWDFFDQDHVQLCVVVEGEIDGRRTGPLDIAPSRSAAIPSLDVVLTVIA